ncbi:MAG: hypothetical protein U9P72_07620 [Campylobacterota bacterium]|nr:hypothetical protein [Campylobacterota bacterium]
MEKSTQAKNITLFLTLISVIVIFIGLLQIGFEKDLSFEIVLSNAFYGTFSFMGGNGTFNTIYPFYMYIAAFTIPMAIFYAVFTILSVQIKHWFYLFNPPKNHILIIGLGNMGYSLFKNIKNENLFMIETEPSQKNRQQVIDSGSLVYEHTEQVLKKLTAKAKEIYLVTDSDISNINIVCEFEQYIDNDTKIYIHLENKTSEILYSPIFEKGISDSKFKYELNSFNIYQKAIWKWFDTNPIEGVIDTTKKDSKEVSILLVGWDRVIKEALEYILNMGHFYNEKPINIKIAVDEIESLKREINFLYPEIQKYTTNNNSINHQLWKIEVIDLQEYYATINDDFNFTNIIISLETIQKSSDVAYRFLNFHYKNLEENHTKIAYWSGDFNLNKSINDKVIVESFGNFDNLVTVENIKSEEINRYSKGIRAMYEKTKEDAGDPWQNSFFNYWSNIYAHLHKPIKQREFERLESQRIEITDKGVIEKARAIFKNSDREIEDKYLSLYLNCLGKIAGEMIEQKQKNLEQFAKVEHNRWNAYHIINGYTYSPVKNKDYKEHDCIVDWDAIKNTKFDTIKYDYQNFFESIEKQLNKKVIK